MLVLVRGGDVLLEKRPPTGIWGGLWCFPEAPSVAAAVRLAARHGCEARATVSLPIVSHGFTHFTLDIEPVLAHVGTCAARAGEPGTMWLPVDEAAGGAVPVPVRRILAALGRAGDEGPRKRKERERPQGKRA